MALLLKNGSVFLHIPKTGGNWVTHVLTSQNLVHTHIAQKHADMPRTARALRNRRRGSLRERWRERVLTTLGMRDLPFMFTFVRHPLSWYESWFRYQSQDKNNWRPWGREGVWHPNSPLNGLGDPDFNEFVRKVVRHRPGYVSQLFSSYTSPEVSFIGKQENLRADLCQALRAANERFDEDFIMTSAPVGVSEPPCAPPVWEPSVREAALQMERSALERFSYTSHRVIE